LNPKSCPAHTRVADVQTIYDLIHELADYEKSTDLVKATPELLGRTLSHYEPSLAQSPEGPFFTQGYAKTLLIVAPEGEVAGMGLYFYNYSTWTGVPGIYLEDLFVKPKFRKRGYGKTLIKALANEVLKVKGQRLEWSCLDWNTPSLEFYKSLGAKQKAEWVGLRVDGEDLTKLAQS
jgi:GNAT superfamily N-acetyltransferase